MRTFESLIKDLNEKAGEDSEIRLTFDFNMDKFKKVFKKSQALRLLNFQVFMYLCFKSTFNKEIPSFKQISKELGMEIKEVKEAIMNLKDYGVLEDIRNKNKGDDLIWPLRRSATD